MNANATPNTDRRPRGFSGWAFLIWAVLLALAGLVLVVMGGRLALLGGSLYYLLAGVVLVAAAFFLGKGRSLGVWLLGGLLIATLLWAWWEVGNDGWALVPRLAWLAVVGMITAAFWPVVRRSTRPVAKGPYFALMAGVPVVMGAAILVPLLWPNTILLGTDALASQRPADAFSRGTVPTPDGNVAANHDASSWTAYAGSNLANHYTPSAQVNKSNVKDLEIAWHYHTGDVKAPDSNITYATQNTPLKVGNTVYVCSPTQQVIALDANNGSERWRFNPKTDPVALSRAAASVCRGVSYYQAPAATTECPTRIFWPTADGRLGAIDASNGKLCTGFGKAGFVDLNDHTGNTLAGFVGPTSPPVVMRGVVIQPTGQVRDGQERAAPSGVVRAFDAISGELRWAWDLGRPETTLLPPDGEVYTRGTPNVWSPMAADDELGLVYLPTGNASGDFYAKERTKEEEEFTASIVAVDAGTGRVRWHFRTVNHDLWDFDLGPPPNLVDWPMPDGSRRAAMVQATKAGPIFVLDRATGEPLLPVEQVAVPQGTDHGDWTAATQPLSPGMPNTIGRPDKEIETLRESDTWGISAFDQLVCRIQFKQMRYEGIYTPPTLQGTLAHPGNHGGINWGGVSIDVQRGIMVMNSNRLPYTEHVYTRETMDEMGVVSIFRGKSKVSGYMAQMGLPFGAKKEPWMSPLETPCIAPPWGYLTGVDLRTQEVIWRRPLGTGYDHGPMGIPSRMKFTMGTPNNSGSLATAGGLVFIGAALDNFLRAFDSETGELVWETRLPAGLQAAPMSYEVNGRQYIVAAVGGHERMDTKLGDSVIAWALPAR
ncbi:membrane-bound PQQ-dependent dehydrogenase, glucose/quinate/shikimate family [Hydrogenophaga sp.]|uniref:membrane-bound PQQ-dependent dehydrogenase, glucose/quinate/shikimate family n=1 Tax=Hydrogenophaga sp. TaxID=1904254 RepID=UPI0027288E77|nr:membrane-bound PQQ-dependent dehydrogenase, glucose/quinate/shikimate family [Hydrogenophaga sp.]MDO9433826.1 membrane-bound PQQ-dependent dehydrogenase, glucose/quinate/shikimate family [Hydrogenophaga sp.]